MFPLSYYINVLIKCQYCGLCILNNTYDAAHDAEKVASWHLVNLGKLLKKKKKLSPKERKKVLNSRNDSTRH